MFQDVALWRSVVHSGEAEGLSGRETLAPQVFDIEKGEQATPERILDALRDARDLPKVPFGRDATWVLNGSQTTRTLRVRATPRNLDVSPKLSRNACHHHGDKRRLTDDYYAGEGEASEWQGRGAEMLGLSGAVDSARFRELLAGRVAVEGGALRSTTRHDAQNRIGIDLTFSAPKSVSLQALVGGDARIVEAHDRAVARAVEVAEERAQARKKVAGQSHVEDTRNLVVAKFRHETSREQDPQLHTHALVLNLTRRSDGEWRALRNDEIVKATKYLGAVYRAELAAELQKLGYSLRHERQGLFELTHMKRGQLAAFSQRTAQIERRLAAEGLTTDTATAHQMQRVKLATRPPKVSADRQALFAEWKERAREVEIDFTRRGWPLEAGARRSTVPDPAAHAAAEGARRSVRFAIAHLTERQAIIAERELLDVALKHGVGRATLPDVRREIERLSSSGYLVPESPLYRWPDAPLDAPAYPRDLWVAAHVERGLEHQEARARFDLDVESGRLVPVERRYTTQTALERERRILHV